MWWVNQEKSKSWWHLLRIKQSNKVLVFSPLIYNLILDLYANKATRPESVHMLPIYSLRSISMCINFSIYLLTCAADEECAISGWCIEMRMPIDKWTLGKCTMNNKMLLPLKRNATAVTHLRMCEKIFEISSDDRQAKRERERA